MLERRISAIKGSGDALLSPPKVSFYSFTRRASIGAEPANKEAIMAEDENPLEGADFENALAKLEASPTAELQSVATLIAALRDAVLEMQAGGEDEEEEEDEED
jgi:hypothetical protein